MTAFFFPKSKSEEAAIKEQYVDDILELVNAHQECINDLHPCSDKYTPKNHRLIKEELAWMKKKANLYES